MSNNWRTPATSRQSARAAKPATMAQKPGAPVRKPTAAAKVTKKDGADDSDSDEDSDDLMAMMIAASLVAQSEGRGGRPGSSDGPSGLEALLLGAMLARAKQKRESEAEKNKSAEEKKGKERLERKEEAEKRDRVGADRREAARAAPRGPSHIESFAEWIARREREKSEKTTESTNPFRMTPASTSTARESGKTEIPQKGPKFKVPPRPQAQASPPSSVDPFRPRPTTMVTDQPTLQVPPAPKELSKPLAPPVAKKATEPTSKPVPAPTPYKRTGPKFKVPPLSAAQKKPE
ncbi:hypothetical protein BGZ60DRAFT_421370 [Tricladium varicosporioides]|nr:hypothetical protein BGZ60DRAFT_421370 [Hymenoscyphus varicosporioides]